MTIPRLQPCIGVKQVNTEIEVGTGSLTSLVSEGFAPGTLGYDSSSVSKELAYGTVVFSEESSNFYNILEGTSGLCAVLVSSADSSGTIAFTDETQSLTVTCQWGTADPGNTITLTNLEVIG